MPTPAPYYIDSQSFTTATAVYTDAQLTTKAPDGYYQNCGQYRQQTAGVLGPIQICPFCEKAVCGTKPTAGWTTSSQGVYDFEIDLGTGTNVNWQVKLTSSDIPTGIFVTHNSVVYSAGSSSAYGWLAGPYFGKNSEITAYDFPNFSPYAVNKMNWDGLSNGSGVGTGFVPSGSTENIVVAPGDVSGVALNPGVVNLFIPKIAAEPRTATIRIVGPVGANLNSVSLSNTCPVALTSFSASGRFGAAVDACTATNSNTYYNGPVTGTAGEPALYDVIFTDVAGSTKLATSSGAGFYGFTSSSASGYFEIDANSVIIAIGSCPP